MNWGLNSIPFGCLAVTLPGLTVTTAYIPATIHFHDAHPSCLLSRVGVTVVVEKGLRESDNSGKMNSAWDTNLANYNLRPNSTSPSTGKFKLIYFTNIFSIFTGYRPRQHSDCRRWHCHFPARRLRYESKFFSNFTDIVLLYPATKSWNTERPEPEAFWRCDSSASLSSIFVLEVIKSSGPN